MPQILRNLISRGFSPEPDPPPEAVFWVRSPGGDWTALPPGAIAARFQALTADTLCLLLPTYVSRCPLADQLDSFDHIVAQAREAGAAQPEIQLVFVAGMQLEPGQEQEAARRLKALGERLEPGASSCFLGLALSGTGKRRTVDLAVRTCASPRVRGWIWIDDDVRMAPGCLGSLVERFVERGCRGAVGAAVTPLSTGSPSRWVRSVKAATVPPRAYPQACCMLVETGILARGIPPRRFSDDGFVLFELLDPDRENPFHDLEVLPVARCSTAFGGGWRATVRRFRRNLYSHILSMADYPADKARLYFRSCLFHGLWPLAPWDGRRGFAPGLRKWLAKAVHFAWFCSLSTSLAWRGLIRRPLRSIDWGGASRPVADHADQMSRT